jgi:hypothetical protein
MRGVIWIIVAKKRAKWHALLNTEIHLRVLKIQLIYYFVKHQLPLHNVLQEFL